MRTYFENGGGYCYLVTCDYGNRSIPLFDDITLIVSAGQNVYQDGWTNIEQLCYPGSGRFAIVDGPTAEITSSYNPSGTFKANSCAAAYYPYLKASWTANQIPCSAAVAGIYCSVDRTRGVWKAPANVALTGSLRPLYSVTDDIQGQFNQGLAINMLRSIANNGLVVRGARTLEDSDNWRYISVRRLFISAERDILKSMQTMVFEPNSQPTWEKVRSAITNYLHNLWQQGALVGATEKEAYFVQIGEGVTMSADDIAQGKMIVNVGMAAVRPAEFIILTFSQNVAT